MLASEQNKRINDVMNKIFGYINTNLNLKKDLDDYYNMAGISKDNKRQLSNYTINYIFERRLNKKTIFDYALAGMNNINAEERALIKTLNNSVDGIFEVRKITHSNFELFNIINEKAYTVKPMEKMVKFRNLSVGHFLFARILHLDNEYFLYHVVDHITYPKRVVAFQIAISRLAQNPSLFYFDNPEKLKELKDNSKNLTDKFEKLFKSKVVTTSNKSADALIGFLNEYIETKKKPADTKVKKHLAPLETSTYFDIEELKEGKNLLLEAKKGFSSQNKEYNISLIADEKSGLQVVPFLDVFLSVFEKDNYQEIPNYKNCVEKFITTKQITPIALEMANEKYPETFLTRVNEILGTEFQNLDEILQKYKQFHLDNPYTSSTLTLYSSYAFKRLISVLDEAEEKSKPTEKVGRNDLCPCGSGLKYKKCCGVAVQI